MTAGGDHLSGHAAPDHIQSLETRFQDNHHVA